MTAGLRREHLEAMQEEKAFRAAKRDTRDARIRKLATDGRTVIQIAKCMGIHWRSVHRVLTEAGIQAQRQASTLAEGLPAS